MGLQVIPASALMIALIREPARGTNVRGFYQTLFINRLERSEGKKILTENALLQQMVFPVLQVLPPPLRALTALGAAVATATRAAKGRRVARRENMFSS